MTTKFFKGKKHYAWIFNLDTRQWECIAVIVSPGLSQLLRPKLEELYNDLRWSDKPAYEGIAPDANPL